MTFETGLLIAGIILLAATVLAVVRIIVGPTILDRAVAADMLTVLLVMAVGLVVAANREQYGVPVMLALTALAFLGTVAVARFVGREDRARDRAVGAAEPGVEVPGTGPGGEDADDGVSTASDGTISGATTEGGECR